ncbi:hypothetical protein B0H11DRAFT_1674212, partial [Mycena galericulata]
VMPAEISIDLKKRIVKWYLEDEHTMEEIVDLAGVSLGLVSKTVNLYLEHGQVNNPSSKRTGRPRTLNDGDRDYIVGILVANPTLYLDEIQSKLQSVRN